VTDEERVEARQTSERFALQTQVGTSAHVELLKKIAETLYPHLPDYARLWEYQYVVLPKEKASVDAQVLPGGIIIFSAETFDVVPSVDMLAVILAHEMGHVALDSVVAERQQETLMFMQYMELVMAGQHVTDPAERKKLDEERVSALTRVVDGQTIRRELEFEADVFGAHIAHRAGYDLRVGAEYFESQAEKYALQGADDHPTFSDRAKLLRCFEPHDTKSHETLREALRNIQERKQAP
jgi:predicted Zn-dependent protease